MQELTPEQFQAVKEFADNLIECFQIKFTDNGDSIINKSFTRAFSYAITTTQLHLRIAEQRRDMCLNNMAKEEENNNKNSA